MNAWLKLAENNGMIINSCSDFRWSRSKCSEVPLMNGTKRHRTAYKNTALFTGQIHEYGCALNAALLHDENNGHILQINQSISIYTYIYIYMFWCNTVAHILVSVPEQLQTVPELLVNAPEQLIHVFRSSYTSSGRHIYKSSEAAVSLSDELVCRFFAQHDTNTLP